MYTILVQKADDNWTMQALHLACAMARNTGANVALLRLTQVQHLSYLGTPFGNNPPDHEEQNRLKEYTLTAEDYGVELTHYSMQCTTPLDAVVEAAEQIEARVVFAQVPASRISYWRRFQLWSVKRRMHAGCRELYTLDQPIGVQEWAPAITVKTAAWVD
jgi:hypothetical protein